MFENNTESKKNPKLTWRVSELPAATGLGVDYWRQAIRLKKIPVIRVGSKAVLISDKALREHLQLTPEDID